MNSTNLQCITGSTMSDDPGYEDHSVTQNNRGLVNLAGHVTGNGNGNFYHVHVNINHVERLNYPWPGYAQSWQDFSKQTTTLTYGNNIHGHLVNRSSSSSSPKRAVLCGVTYGKRKYRLRGTVNDVINMKNLLLYQFQFPMGCIRVLTEEEQDPNFIPTKRNIMESLKWLVKDCRAGDSLVFYYSGHGLQQPENHEEDEIDGLDETICPVDFMKEGMITDDEINATIVRPLKKGVTLHAIIDACHSGTALDLMYVYKKDNGSWKWVNNRTPSKEPITKSTNGGLAICLSACEDYSQMATDTAAFGGKEMNGVMTFLLTKTIREHSGITYAGLLQKLQEEIEKIHQSKFFNGFLNRIFHRKVEQINRGFANLAGRVKGNGNGNVYYVNISHVEQFNCLGPSGHAQSWEDFREKTIITTCGNNNNIHGELVNNNSPTMRST